MKRKAGKIQEFLSTYCTRGRQNDEDGQVVATVGSKQKPGSKRQSNQHRLRNIVNVDKVLEDELVAPQGSESIQREEVKTRLSR